MVEHKAEEIVEFSKKFEVLGLAEVTKKLYDLIKSHKPSNRQIYPLSFNESEQFITMCI